MVVERWDYAPADSGFTTEAPFPPEIPEEHLHITFELGAQPSRQLEAVMDNAYDFARNVPVEYGTEVLAWMNKKRHTARGIHPAIQEQVENGGYTPVFTFYDRYTVPDFYQRIRPLQGKNENRVMLTMLKENELVMIFDMPEAISRLWWHGKNPYRKENTPGTEKGIKPRKIRQLAKSGAYVPFPFFGDAYQNLRDIFWQDVEIEETHAKVTWGDLVFSRLNPAGNHKPLEYYYVFRVSPRETNVIYLFGRDTEDPDTHGRAS